MFAEVLRILADVFTESRRRFYFLRRRKVEEVFLKVEEELSQQIVSKKERYKKHPSKKSEVPNPLIHNAVL